jgi:hypothetical protein
LSCFKARLHEHFFAAFFLLLTDVNERTNKGCAECVLPHLYIRDWFTRSHPSKGGNRSGNCSCKRAFLCIFRWRQSIIPPKLFQCRQKTEEYLLAIRCRQI